MEILDKLPPAVTLVLALLLLVWLVLLLLVPFMIEGIRGWSRRTCQELADMNRKLDALTTLLAERGATQRSDARVDANAGRAAAPAAPVEKTERVERPERTRKEPTI